ncbi:uncharacterized protein LOC114241097 [Bombyx mandarina]|uniref:Uncharacterized protein LOC114241097 n=1 Tax=Bombyx mandarina TaxID=7092 RepID=A0A6J2JDS5_BOMMA|nr:uncharacterized protein LOC114241097 [Bombyx mandarina]
MSEYQNYPFKLYIQDIFRAKNTEHKYVYEMFGSKFKNVMIQGVVTSVYNSTNTTTNFELTDATGTVQAYYDLTKNNSNLSENMLKDLNENFEERSRSGDENLCTMAFLMERLLRKNKFDFFEGNYLSVIGDIFVDDKNTRMISAYECKINNIERDVIWMEELRYLYEKFYLWSKEP